MRGRNVPKWITNIQNGYTFRGSELERCFHFNIDHPFVIRGTCSYVFYPYEIDVSKIEGFRQLLEAKGYTLEFMGGSEYGYDTLKIVIKHKDDNWKSLGKGFRRIQKEIDERRM